MAKEPSGRDVRITWQGRRASAWVPAFLAERDLTLDSKSVGKVARAAAEVNHAAADVTIDDEPLVRLLLRAEGVASSSIEGLRAPLVDVVLAEEGLSATEDVASWVAANQKAISEGIAGASASALSLEMLCGWHRTLMRGSPLPGRYVGVVRDEQGWIGGTDPTNAVLITAPPEYLGALLTDLIAYANRDDLDPLAQAAVAHAQFEVIHPFADGNGRLGRVLVASLLTRRLSLLVPPPVSLAMATDIGGYLAGLALFRLGDHDPWVQWFADAVSRGATMQRSLVNEVARLKDVWRERLGERTGRALRSDATAWGVLGLLPRHLVLTSDIVTSRLGVTAKAAVAALRKLAEATVLLEYGTVPDRSQAGGRPPKLYVSTELLALAGSDPLRPTGRGGQKVPQE